MFDAGRDYDAKFHGGGRHLAVERRDGYFAASWENHPIDPWRVETIDRDRGRAEELLLKTLEARVKK